VLSTPIKSTCTLGLRDPRGSLRKGEKAGAQEYSCYSRNILVVLQDAFVLDYEARLPSVDGGNAMAVMQLSDFRTFCILDFRTFSIGPS
jgi:hypothetical protein